MSPVTKRPDLASSYQDWGQVGRQIQTINPTNRGTDRTWISLPLAGCSLAELVYSAKVYN